MSVYKKNDDGMVELVRADLSTAVVAEAKQARLTELELPSSGCMKELFAPMPMGANKED